MMEPASRVRHIRKGKGLRIAAVVVLAVCALIVVSLPLAAEGAPSPGTWYFMTISAIFIAAGVATFLICRHDGVTRSRAIGLALAAVPLPYAIVVLLVWVYVSVLS
jgi:hypothetical protein